ncbi:MAG TPA: Stp1/IreP family PP2C-type Ser/Thr phosphatase [Agitococcus sp.]|nr:Stp1/IreP family PP2C-type Ser/Thr phosphatase [Agitococcus sp.]HNC01815.1 Stp1/IreP family PP2C-type Ser/Thr phosphatase [Agitococcus sp.]HNI61831.1 Stp1/IreP family PP2C-type Ser/Thr phosphatase [Agitococcus sp.]HNL78989.1 Stp1/IreP family PP2C-type Ser/Thr phosphatase [Agitococcus sp.]
MNNLIMVGHTDTGKTRTSNEDAILCLPNLGVALLADGMGGHSAGEVASRTAIDTVSAILKQTTRGVSPHERLETALQAAHAVIREKARQSVRCRGMGTTFVGILIENGYLHHAHVGDSRLYLWRDGQLMAVTHDHSLLQEFIDQGFYTREEALEKVSRNILTRALGLEPHITIDYDYLKINKGDRFLLCSDGLYDMLSDYELGALLGREHDLEGIALDMLELANARRSKDNVSVIVIAGF